MNNIVYFSKKKNNKDSVRRKVWEKNLESSEYQNKFFAKLQRATRKTFHNDSKYLFLQAWFFLVLHLFAFCFLCKYLLTAFYKFPWIIRQQERKQKIIPWDQDFDFKYIGAKQKFLPRKLSFHSNLRNSVPFFNL